MRIAGAKVLVAIPGIAEAHGVAMAARQSPTADHQLKAVGNVDHLWEVSAISLVFYI